MSITEWTWIIVGLTFALYIGIAFYTKAKYSPYAGMELKGKVTTTIVNGNIVWENNKFIETQGAEVEFS